MKINLPNLPKMKKPAPARGTRRRAPAKGAKRPPAKLKLNASVARRAPRALPEEDDYYDDEQEPNMKLSHAFVVVLVLHVIAVAGVFAFSTIKTRQSPVFSETAATSETNDPFTPASAKTTTAAAAADPTATRAFEPRSVTQAAPQTASEKVTADFKGETHEMRPGDTLTRVAGIYNVSIAAIQTENNITDPTKIRVGELIRIPTADTAASASVPAVATATSAQT
ncbi:MAG: LysM domain-containing protein, partial [Chthoniobacterales bacterium]